MMTDQPEPQIKDARPIHPLYQPADHDSYITAHFIGNTPVISGYEGDNAITPWHMLAAAEDMKRKAFQMIQAAEIAEAKERQKVEAMGIQTATKIPPVGRFVPGG